MLPLAAWYALMAVFCMAVFAVIYYPKLYGPKLYEFAKAKLVEYKVDQHAITAVNKVRTKSVEAYSAAASSEVTAKGLGYLNQAYTATTSTPVAVALSNKGGELAAKGRAKLAEKLIALRDGEAATREPAEPQTPV